MQIVGIIGSTGLVGSKAIEIIKNRSLPVVLRAFSSRSGGRKVHGVEVEKLDDVPENLDFAIFSAGSAVSKFWAKKFADRKIICIDNTSAFRMDKNVPLVVPQVNFRDIKKDSYLIANPNCATIPVVRVLSNFKDEVTAFHAVTFQSVSGAGRRGFSALSAESRGEEAEDSPFEGMIFDNVIPMIGEIRKSGCSQEEIKLVFETRKILHREDLMISAVCVRIPVTVGHSVSLTLEGKGISAQKVRSYIERNEYVTYRDVPTPQDIRDSDSVTAGRIKDEEGRPGFVSLFVCADNLRVGAATNAVDILERLL
ncbi:aspartate-semialdehyde dehydrogenase [candidate division WOR-3 bacterium]|nr:aspartate-semialdehyde dehydrogenase [candidate division WOR-3 bacterium]